VRNTWSIPKAIGAGVLLLGAYQYGPSLDTIINTLESAEAVTYSAVIYLEMPKLAGAFDHIPSSCFDKLIVTCPQIDTAAASVKHAQDTMDGLPAPKCLREADAKIRSGIALIANSIEVMKTQGQSPENRKMLRDANSDIKQATAMIKRVNAEGCNS
jgi:hypothetical protein